MLAQTAFHRVFQLLSQMSHVCFHGRKRVHTRLSEKDRTRGHTRRNRGLPSLVHSVVLCCRRYPFYSAMLLYTYISRFSVTPHYISRGRKSGKATAINFIPNRSSLRLSTSLTNGPHSLLRVKVSTPSASLKESHARAHRAKHGAFRMGGAVTAILILKLKSGFV